MLGAERRKQPRVAWNGDVTVQVGMQCVDCEGCDISESGMRVVGDWGAYAGQSVTLKFRIDGHPVHAFGVVEWAMFGDLDHVWGIRFTAVHLQSRKRISNYVEHQLHTPVEPIDVGLGGRPEPVWTEHPTPVGFEGAIFEPDAMDDLEEYVDTNRMFAEPSSVAEEPRLEPTTLAEPMPVVPVQTGETVVASLEQIYAAAAVPQPVDLSPSTVRRVEHRREVEQALRSVSDSHAGPIAATPGRRLRRSGR